MAVTVDMAEIFADENDDDGTMSEIALVEKVGVVIVGNPNHAASEIFWKLIGVPMPRPFVRTA